ncbi:MAG: hypothetical protein ACE10K_15915, partial [Rhodothermales bacterium]
MGFPVEGRVWHSPHETWTMVMAAQRLSLILLILLLCLIPDALAQEAKKEDDKKWDVTAAHGPVKTVSFTTTEGT